MLASETLKSQIALIDQLVAAGQSTPTVLDIHFQPTNVFPWERTTILDILRKQRQNLLFGAEDERDGHSFGLG